MDFQTDRKPLKKYALRISYKGTQYCGWQKQSKNPLKAPPRPCIQEIVEQALSKLMDQPMGVIASGRTDSGVHALGQVVHFKIDQLRPKFEVIVQAMNSLLPEDIRVTEIWPVDPSFHAQQSAIKKQYSYFFQQGPAPMPHWMDHTWWIRKNLNVDAMNEAVKTLIGEHDFKVFQASGAKPDRSTVRTIFEAEVLRLPMPDYIGNDLNERGFSLVRVRLVGSGFLKQMVRGIAGTLLQIGEDQRPANAMKFILESQDRQQVGPTAPAKGLTLEQVWYTLDPYGNSG